MGRTEFVGVDWAGCGWFSVGFAGNGEYTVRAFAEFEERHWNAGLTLFAKQPASDTPRSAQVTTTSSTRLPPL